jgi:hypothetical protein
MGAMNGANMLRVLGVLTTAALMATRVMRRRRPRAGCRRRRSAAIDVTALLAAARGAPPLICGLAAQVDQQWQLGVAGPTWPASPLGAATRPLDATDGRSRICPTRT